MQLAPTSSKDVTSKVSLKPPAKTLKDSTKHKPEAALGAFQKILQGIEKSDPVQYPELHESMIQEFIKQSDENVSFTVTSTNIKDTMELKNNHHKFSQEYVFMEYSPNGDYSVGVTRDEEIILIDLTDKKNHMTGNFIVLPIDQPAAKKSPPKKSDPVDEDYVPSEDPITKNDPKSYTTLAMGNPATKDDDASGPFIRSKPIDLNLSFSTDSTILAVSRGTKVSLFNCKQACMIDDWQNATNAMHQFDFAEDANDEELGNIRFMYFHTPSFDWQRYPTIDVETLVIGIDAGVLVKYLQKDNQMLKQKDFNMQQWLGEDDWMDEAGGFEGTEAYREAMVDSKNCEFFTNKDNYIYFIKKKQGSQAYLMGYRIDWDNPSRKRRFMHRLEYKINENVQIFYKTFSPDGRSVFAVNKKFSQVQRLKLDTTNQYDEVYTLTGSKKNLRHLAVKDDGKYLLLVDQNYRVEVLLKSTDTYANLVSFNAATALEQTSFMKLRATNRYGKYDKAEDKSEIEHDVSNMEFLEDGSGIVCSNIMSCIVWHLQLPHTRFNASIYLKDHFFMANFRMLRGGTYFIDFPCHDQVNHQKIIDFNPATNKGCIVRTFNTEDGDIDYLFDFENMYNQKVKSKNLMSQGYASNADIFRQLKNFLKNTDSENSLFFAAVPGTDTIIAYSLDSDSFRCFDRKAMLNRDPDSDNEEGLILWSMEGCDLMTEIEGDNNYQFFVETDEWKFHSPLVVDCEGKYFINIRMTDDDKRAATVNSTATGEKICVIQDVHTAASLRGQRVIIFNHDAETVEMLKEGLVQQPGKGKMTIKIFDLATKAYIGKDATMDASIVHLADSIKFEDRQPSARNQGSGEYALLVADNKLIMFDLEKCAQIDSVEICHIEEKIPLSNEFLTNCLLMSPDKRFIALCSIEDCENITIVQINDGYFYPMTIQLKSKTDRINRWCFSQDSKFFLVKSGDNINTYKLNDRADYEMIGIVPIDESITKLGKVLAINLWNNSQDLEIVFGYKNYILFNRAPFYARAEDLMLGIIHTKIKEYFSDITSVKADQRASNIGLIMAQQPAYQRRMDDTYVKILAMCDNARVLDKYFSYQKEDTDIIFKYKSFASIILMNTKDDKQRDTLKMHQNTSNSFIDLMEKYVIDRQKFPDIDRAVLENWLKSEKLDITYMRKLLKLITFEPVNAEFKGELKNGDNLATSLKPYTHSDGTLKATDAWIMPATDKLIDQGSTTQVDLKCFKTSISFDLSNGSEFSLNYFRWLNDSSDEDITEFYKSVIYYKWQKVYPAAVVYSCIFWILNALYVAFMGFAYDNLGLLVVIVILNILFILYEVKCFSFTFRDSYKDIWNYYDILIHVFSIFSVFFVYVNSHLGENYKYSWLRLFSFVLISLRAFMMLRIFKQTRYLIVMLLEVFWDMRPFLSVFSYIIFIYWFVCLVRPGLVIGGERDTTFYVAVQQAMNIAFDNFSAEVDSVMVFVTTILGQLVLSLVLLNYLIAIVNSTYSRISDSQDLYNLRMLIDVIREFDCFFNNRRKFDVKNSEIIFFVLPQQEASDTLEDLRTNFSKLRSELITGIGKSLEQQKTQVEAALESIFKKWVPPLAKQVTQLGAQLEEFEDQIKKKREEEREKEREEQGKKIREIETKTRMEKEAYIEKDRQDANKRMQDIERKNRDEKEEYLEKIKKEKEAESNITLEKEKQDLKEQLEKEGRSAKEVIDAIIELEKNVKTQILMEVKEIEHEEFGRASTFSDTSIIQGSDIDSDEEDEEDEEESDSELANSIADQKEDDEEEYDQEGECQVAF